MLFIFKAKVIHYNFSSIISAIIFSIRYFWQKSTPFILVTDELIIFNRSPISVNRITKTDRFTYKNNVKYIEINQGNKKYKIYYNNLEKKDKENVFKDIQKFKRNI